MTATDDPRLRLGDEAPAAATSSPGAPHSGVRPPARGAGLRRQARPDSEQVLDALDPEQREVALAVSGPVVVLAGAGTGKTRAITHRIAYAVLTGQHDPRRSLAVTFTARAAGEMRQRLAELGVEGVQARTFHSAALRQLRYFWPRSIGGQLWPVLEHKLRLVAIAARRANAGTDAATLRDLASEIEWSKATLAGPKDYLAAVAKHQRDTPLPAEQVAKVFAVYESV